MILPPLPHVETSRPDPLRLFTLYADSPAAARALWANSTISHFIGKNWVTSTQWTVDALTPSASRYRMIHIEAMQADILVVAASLLNDRPAALIAWLETLVACRHARRNPGLLIGLFGNDDHAKELSWTINQCLSCAQRMNRDFIWQWLDAGAMAEPAWLTDQLAAFLVRQSLEMDKIPLSDQALAVV